MLYQNGKKLLSKKITVSSDWQYSFTDLPEFNEDGVAYHYTISVEKLDGYQTEVNGYDVIHTSLSTKSDSNHSEKVSTGSTNSEASGDPVPDTATNLYNFLLSGIVAIIMGIVLLLVYRRYRSV